jgi:nitrite reductase/ring-hydroxylating ferredoxin subunit
VCAFRNWVDAAGLDAFDSRNVVGVEIGGRRVALYRLDGAYYATSNVCTHAGALLSAGEVVECYIECPLHFALFDIRSGKAQGGHAAVDLATYPVEVRGDRLFVGLTTGA